jgi:hypothetical protein
LRLERPNTATLDAPCDQVHGERTFNQPLRADASPEESAPERNFHQTFVRSMAIDQLAR